MSTCNIPGCAQPAVLNRFWTVGGVRCEQHQYIEDWIPCSVAMPPIGQSVLAHDGNTAWVMAYTGPETETIPAYVGQLVWDDGRDYTMDRASITRWANIPRLPVEMEGQNSNTTGGP